MDKHAPVSVVPAHVPERLVVDVDIYDIPGGSEDPQRAWLDLHINGEGSPLSYSPRNGGHWIATTAQSVFEIIRDTRHFSNASVVIPRIENLLPMIPLETDSPNHSVYRKTIMPLFTSDAIDKLEIKVRKLCVDLIAEFRARGECDFIQEFAFKFPIGIFMEMMGLPDKDRVDLRQLVERFVDTSDISEKIRINQALIAYIDRALDERVGNPLEDATTMILNATFEGRPYTREEMQGTILLLLFAGLDTVAGFLSFVMHYLAQNPEQTTYIQSRLNNNTAMHEIVQELLRRFAIANVGRVVVEDYVFRGVTLHRGEMVLLPTSIFNMDPERIERPNEIDFNRQSFKHISFGSGPHTCAGALLARKEVRLFLEEWLKRIPQFRLHPDKPSKLQALPLNQVRALWLQWDA